MRFFTGNESRIGETAKKYLLEPRMQRQPAYLAVKKRSDFSVKVQRVAQELTDYLRERQCLSALKGNSIRCKSPRWNRAWTAYLRSPQYTHWVAYKRSQKYKDWLFQKCRFPHMLKNWALRVALKGRTQVQQVADECQSEILRNSNIILCTIASTGRLLREWTEVCGKAPKIHTVIVDECGCTTESSTALLIRLNPTNLIMVGDHKQ